MPHPHKVNCYQSRYGRPRTKTWTGRGLIQDDCLPDPKVQKVALWALVLSRGNSFILTGDRSRVTGLFTCSAWGQFSKEVVPVHAPSRRVWTFQLFHNLVSFSVLTFLVVCDVCLLVFICISPITNQVGYIYISLLAIWVAPTVNDLFKSLAKPSIFSFFLIVWVFFKLVISRSYDIFFMQDLYHLLVLQISSLTWHFNLLLGAF